ncbi:GAF domain-containing protein [Chryseosolibacter indicus]|uniref:GAF domain-containing protein n=1 Tax=Chryseosolibacter indicus TaxID=2782351 RepID=A0ABS5VN69_9BACT|nr:GAF domain-containing protein [Chryseosolibacter indicus]MBT1702895.1 GAF domain-containing protein [Chryseosolibacter indicus]
MKPTNYDSDFCGSLPIHLTNLIQPYGVLLIVNKVTAEIIQASENTDAVFGKPVQEVVSSALSDHLQEKTFKHLQEKLNNEFNDHIPSVWEINKKHFLVLIHRKEKYLVVEIDAEPVTLGKQESFVEVYQEVKVAMSSIEATKTIEETCMLATKELKRISGFDKVMIYSFDSEWNGTVLAEEKESDMEAYMGFTFPASDIPKQARQLYLKNPYRFIPDRDYKPVKLYPVINPATGSFIDLSDCNLRSVAAVHVEYLKNMGVTASMSTRIMHQDTLWGLIACHHKTAKYMSFEMCSIFEMISSMISVKITSLQNQSSLALENNIKTGYAQLIESVFKSNELDKNLLSQQGVLQLFDASGAVVTRNGRFYTEGETPRQDQLEELLLWLHTKELKKVFATEILGYEYEYGRDYADVGSGMLVIPINYLKDQYLILFRKEKVRIINWGGNPEERIQFEKDEKNYHPRNSFKQWQQKVQGVSQSWKKEELDIAETLRSFIYEYETSSAY